MTYFKIILGSFLGAVFGVLAGIAIMYAPEILARISRCKGQDERH